MCDDRGRGKPLQYILGTQPFGEVEILCRAGVLVPRCVWLVFLSYTVPFPEILGYNGSTPAEEEERGRWADRVRAGLRGYRPETESYTTHLAHLILSRHRHQQQQQQSTWPLPPLQSPHSDNPSSTPAEAPPPLRILDLCTGTGCIPILLHSLLSPHFPSLQILGVDISPRAIALARRNLAHNIAKNTLAPVAKTQIRFLRGDVLHAGRASRVSVDDTGRERGKNAHHDGRRRRRRKLGEGEGEGEGDVQGEGDEYLSKDWHIVTCNPPYISPHAFNTCTARSVRTFEPMLALVPPSVSRLHAGSDIDNHSRSSFATSTPIPLKGQYDGEKGDYNSGDAFYPSILSIATRVKARVLVMEVGDMAQAERVAGLARALSSADEGKGTKWDKVVIWRDWIDHPDADASKEAESGFGLDVDVRGEGNGDPEGSGRVVACFRGWV